MNDFFYRLIRNCKGGVTVFVTLLLIPAILITGTGVDTARIYAARSMVRNANQLAANSALARYDALLYDLYGLFAVMQEDDVLAGLLDAYIRYTLFGERITGYNENEPGRGSTMFHNSDGNMVAVEGLKPLSEGYVLRRQIEEYVKFRAPVIIVNEILERLDVGMFETAANDGEAIRRKLEITDGMYGLVNTYEEFYNELRNLESRYSTLETEIFRSINEYQNEIRQQMATLDDIRLRYEETYIHVDEDDENWLSPEELEEKRDELRSHYDAVQRNIRVLVTGGNGFGSGNWNAATNNWSTTEPITPGFEILVRNHISDLENFRSRFDSIIEIGHRIDAQSGQLGQEINRLMADLNSDPESLSEGLAENLKEDLAAYEALLGFNFQLLSEQMRDANIRSSGGSIREGVMAVLRGIEERGFGIVNDNRIVLTRRTFEELRIFNDTSVNRQFQINYRVDLGGIDNVLRHFSRGDNVNFTQTNSFTAFPNAGSLEHQQAYSHLREIGGLDMQGDRSEADEAEGGLLSAFSEIISLYNGLFDYTTIGAPIYVPSEDNTPDSFYRRTGSSIDLLVGIPDSTDGSRSSFRQVIRIVNRFLGGDLSAMSILQDAMNDIANRVLLVTYANTMFSSWTSDRNEWEMSLTGREIKPGTNYFFGSELEYLFNGSLEARSNLQAVAMTIFVIRLIANFTSTYIIPDVNLQIRGIQVKLLPIPFAGKALSLLVRPFYAFAESVYDLSDLRDGQESVPLIKMSASSWNFWIPMRPRTESTGGALSLYYNDYLTLFLLVSWQEQTARRIGNLIMLNVTNERHINTADIEERVREMSRRPLFDLADANTTFRLTTTAEMRFMFLSGAFAQSGQWVNVMPPRRFPIVQVDYRGY